MADLEAMNKKDLAAFQFIASCADSRLRDKLFELKRKDLTSVKVVVEQHACQLKAETTLAGKQAPVAAVNSVQGQTPAAQCRQQTRRQHPALAELKGCCASCGDPSHRPKDCHVKKNGTKCSVCGKPGHLAKVCFTVILDKIKNKSQGGDKPVRTVNCKGDSESSSDAEVWNRLPLNISHDDGSFSFDSFPDTGSAATLIASNVARRKNMRTTGEKPRIMYIKVSGDPVPTDCVVPVTLKAGNHKKNTNAIISPAIKEKVIIGQNKLQRLKVITETFPAPIMVISQGRFNKIAGLKESLIKKYPTVLTDDLPQESMQGCVMKIHLTPREKQPFLISTARQVPLYWREKAEKVVNKLIKERVITRQDEPTEWCAPGFFVIKKNGDLRLVIDYTQLNKYVRRPVHTFPSIQDIISRLDPSSRVFAKLDATLGYHQVPLEEESSKLTTFLLPSGRFRFLRAPMGLSCSSDEFCRRLDKVIEGLSGV